MEAVMVVPRCLVEDHDRVQGKLGKTRRFGDLRRADQLVQLKRTTVIDVVCAGRLR
jgi:hypothetical protein